MVEPSAAAPGLHVISTVGGGGGGGGSIGRDDGIPPDFFVKKKWCCQLHNEAPSLLSQRAWAAQERRQKAWEITWELVPKCVAILGPLFGTARKEKP